MAGLLGGLGIVARDIFSEKEKFEDIPLKDLATYVLFGIVALLLGYVLVYYFVAPGTGLHGRQESVYQFFKANLGLFDIAGAVLGSSTSSAIPVILAHRLRALIEKFRSYSASR